MKSTKLITLFGLIGAFVLMGMLTACQKEDNTLSNEFGAAELKVKPGPDGGAVSKRKGKKHQDPDPDPPTPDPFVLTYQLYQADDSDPLYKFSISQSGTLVLLESDPTVAIWGSDFWGTWANPFPYVNNAVNYIKGLTNTTYSFEQLSANTIDVTKTLIVQPYSTNLPPTTTVTHPGVYMLVE